jgi:hypothetical protein
MLAADTLYANRGAAAANYVSECLASTTDPLIEIMKNSLKRFPQWQNTNGLYNCIELLGFEDSNVKVTGLGSAPRQLFATDACESFKDAVMRKADRCYDDYLWFGPDPLNRVNVALIATGVVVLTACGAVMLNRYVANRRLAEQVRNDEARTVFNS